ncbi:MAG TPA: DUF58 domain-containing protein [Ktedonobacterales bacterium]
MRPWQAILLAFLTGFLALATGWHPLYILMYVLLLMVVVCYFWTRLSVRGLRFTRGAPSGRIQVGEVLEERLILENHHWFPKLWVQMADNSTLPGHHAGYVASLGGRRRVAWKARTLCRLRGKYTLGPAIATTGDPLGLFRRNLALWSEHSLVVLPMVLPLSQFVLLPGGIPGRGRGSQRSLQTTTNAASIREYVPGDSVNHIHWPTTARLGTLMVREYELDPTLDAWIFLDLYEGVQAGQDDSSTEEYGVTIAATLAAYFLRQDISVGLVVNTGRREFVALDRGDRQIDRILEVLAVVHAGSGTSLAEGLAMDGIHFARNTLAIVITPSWHEDWQTGLRHLQRRGVRTAVVSIDPSTFDALPSTSRSMNMLIDLGIPTLVVKRGDPLLRVLEQGPIA